MEEENKIIINNLTFPNPQTSLLTPVNFNLELQIKESLSKPLTISLKYIGNPNDNLYDQELAKETIFELKKGIYNIELQSKSLNVMKIPPIDSLLGLTAMFVNFSYGEQEFERRCYYIYNTEIEQEQEEENSQKIQNRNAKIGNITKIVNLENIQRHILSDKLRIQQFQIQWKETQEQTEYQQQQQESNIQDGLNSETLDKENILPEFSKKKWEKIQQKQKKRLTVNKIQNLNEKENEKEKENKKKNNDHLEKLQKLQQMNKKRKHYSLDDASTSISYCSGLGGQSTNISQFEIPHKSHHFKVQKSDSYNFETVGTQNLSHQNSQNFQEQQQLKQQQFQQESEDIKKSEQFYNDVFQSPSKFSDYSTDSCQKDPHFPSSSESNNNNGVFMQTFYDTLNQLPEENQEQFYSYMKQMCDQFSQNLKQAGENKFNHNLM